MSWLTVKSHLEIRHVNKPLGESIGPGYVEQLSFTRERVN